MKVGIDTFSLHPLKLDPIDMLHWAAERGFDGLQFGYLGDRRETWTEVRAEADRLGLYSHTSINTPNPHLAKLAPDALVEKLSGQIAWAAACGWHELHSSMGGPETRYAHEVPWTTQLADTEAVLKKLGPVLRDHGSRIDLETHGEITTFELVRLVEGAGPDIAGVCFDTANVLCFAEDPVAAARRVAPYTHLTHSKDGIVYLFEKGIQRQGRPPGRGAVDWEQVLPILGEYSPDLPLSIEDHKWLFSADIFLPAWHASNPDLSREELSRVVEMAWQTSQRIAAGELPVPAEYEEIPYADEVEERLTSGRDYLRGVLARTGLG